MDAQVVLDFGFEILRFFSQNSAHSNAHASFPLTAFLLSELQFVQPPRLYPIQPVARMYFKASRGYDIALISTEGGSVTRWFNNGVWSDKHSCQGLNEISKIRQNND